MKKTVIISAICMIIGVFLGTIYFQKTKSQSIADVAQLPHQSPLQFLTHVDTVKGPIYILVGQDHVYFHPFEDMDTAYKSIDISKDNYPKLFEQGVADSSVIQASDYIDPKSKEEFVKLANMQPDHGGYASTFVILVNPFSGDIKNIPNDYGK